MKTIAVILVLSMLAVMSAYRTGVNVGYSAGWSDAHCGAGNQCEAGQE